jgi:large subunit ribosomal protein L30
MAKKTPEIKKLRITLVKSAIGYSEKHKETLRALGFHHISETVEQVDTPSLRGMLRKVNHLVKIEEQETK